MQLCPRSRKEWFRAVFLWLGLFMVACVGVYWMIGMPGKSWSGELPAMSEADTAMREGLRRHIGKVAGEIGERNVEAWESLVACADYLEQTLSALGYEVGVQEFDVSGRACRNLEIEIPGRSRPDEIVVVGAHYDSVSTCPAANDNGSGTAAVLELARVMKDAAPSRTLRFVLFVNEEPPHFLTGDMGSVHYARRCRERNENVVAMMSIETIGYYADDAGSQQYPAPFSYFYPDTGNFIGFVGNLKSRTLVRRAIGSFRSHTQFPSEGISAPGGLPGIGWSDHWSFWKQGYPAIMVTDTAPYRYPHYHEISDTPDKIDYDRTARVVSGLGRVIAELAGDE